MALRDVLARFRIQVDGRALNRASTSVAGLVGSLRTLGGVLIGSALIRGMRTFITQTITMGDELDKASLQVGLSSTELQSWGFAADRAGVDARAMHQSLMRLQRGAFEAANGNRRYAQTFRRLGVNVRDGNGNLRSANDLMLQMADGLGNLDNASERVAISQILMGRSGARLLPMFADGSEGIRQLQERFRQLGGGMSQDFVRQSAAAQDALTDFGVAFDGLKTTLASQVLPALTAMIVGIANLGGAFVRLINSSNILKATFITLGVIFGGFLAMFALVMVVPLVALALIVAAVVAIILVVEDLLAAFRGGPSVIGGFARMLVKFLKEGFARVAAIAAAFWAKLVALGTAFWNGLRARAAAVAQFLSSIFGPALTAAQRFLGALVTLARSIASFIAVQITSAITAITAPIARVLSALWNGIVSRARGALSAILRIVAPIARFIGGRIAAATQALSAGVSSVGQQARVGASNLVSNVRGRLPSARQVANAGIRGAAAISGTAAGALNRGAAAISGAAQQIDNRTNVTVNVQGEGPGVARAAAAAVDTVVRRQNAVVVRQLAVAGAT